MNILLIASMPITRLSDRGIFSDLARGLAYKGHQVYAVSACERREKKPTSFIHEGNLHILQVKTLNNRRVTFVEKVFAVVTTPFLFYYAIRKHLKCVSVDLILFSTPPVTLYPLIHQLKKKYKAFTYLMLKDIWPQVMVDLQTTKKSGIVWHIFEWLAKKLYGISDYIGTMSNGNSKFLLNNYSFVPSQTVEVCPNAAEPLNIIELSSFEKNIFRQKFSIPQDALVLTYGGSFNAPQGISFLVEVLKKFANDNRFYFFLCGAGTDYELVNKWIQQNKPLNIRLEPYLPKEDYFELLYNSDVGLVFLDERFTVSNIPSRALDYMQFSLPVLAAVDSATDFSEIIETGGFGLTSLSGDLNKFADNIEWLFNNNSLRKEMGKSGRNYLEKYWSADIVCDIILQHFNNLEG